MKKIILLTFVLVSFSLSAQEIKWMSLEEDVEAQKTIPKKIMMDAYTVWCGPCKLLEKNTFKNKDVANYVNENFYAVKFNAEGNSVVKFKGKEFSNPNFNSNTSGRNSAHQLSSYFSIKAYPTIIFLDEENNLIAPIPGYKTPQQLELYLKLFNTDAYKEIKEKGDWENYQNNFSYEFKK